MSTTQFGFGCWVYFLLVWGVSVGSQWKLPMLFDSPADLHENWGCDVEFLPRIVAKGIICKATTRVLRMGYTQLTYLNRICHFGRIFLGFGKLDGDVVKLSSLGEVATTHKFTLNIVPPSLSRSIPANKLLRVYVRLHDCYANSIVVHDVMIYRSHNIIRCNSWIINTGLLDWADLIYNYYMAHLMTIEEKVQK